MTGRATRCAPGVRRRTRSFRALEDDRSRQQMNLANARPDARVNLER